MVALLRYQTFRHVLSGSRTARISTNLPPRYLRASPKSNQAPAQSSGCCSR